MRWGRTRQFEENTLIFRVQVEYTLSSDGISEFAEAQASQGNSWIVTILFLVRDTGVHGNIVYV